MNDIEAQSIILSRLQPGEKLVWYGVPSPLRAAAWHLGLLAFITVWTGLAASLFLGALEAIRDGELSADDPRFFVPALLFFFGVTYWLWTAKKIADCWHTAYGLTGSRVIIAVGAGGSTESYGAGAFSNMLRTGDSARGSILFAHGAPANLAAYIASLSQSPRANWGGYKAGLYGIPDPCRVERLIYETLLLK